MEMFLLVLSMWGKTADEEWVYIGNQNVLNQEFTLEQCEKLADDAYWSKHHTNEYYDIQMDCMPKGSELKEKYNG
mgnify:CR=1 FL=1|tara:strand:+ start:51 stop:275 length:225 start_codon:yes stop_codon:yes gene_type:complete